MTGIERASRKLSEELLLTADLARILFEHHPDAVFVVDDDGLIVLANRQAVFLTQYPMSELRWHRIERLVPEAAEARHVEHRAEFARSAQVRPMGRDLDVRLRCRDGSEVPVAIRLSPVVLIQGVFTVASVRPKQP